MTVGRESNIGGVVPRLRHVQVRHVEVSIFSPPESELAEPIRVVHAVEEGGLADIPGLVIHSLVQCAAGGQALPLSLGEDLVDGHLLQVEKKGAGVGSPAPLTGVRRLVTVSTPTQVISVRSSLKY